MSMTAPSDVLLVGSLPFDDVEQAFRTAGELLRGHVGWLPDGEVLPVAGPHRKCPRRIPITTAMTKAVPGYECTAGLM